MAVTITSTPQDYTPSDNPVNWTFSSDQTAQANFSFLVEVYVNNVLTANELVFPDNGINARFDASSYASNATSFPDITDNLSTDANNYADIKITVIERYGTPVSDQASLASPNITVFKARLEDDDFNDWSSLNYIKTGSGSALFLTNFPTSENPKVRTTNEQMRIMMINDNQTFANFVVELFGADGNSIVSSNVLIDTSANDITIFNITPSVIVDSALAITQANFNDAAYYTVNGNFTETYRIDINDNCEFSHYRRVHFLTEIGSIESLSFDLISKESSKITSFGYRNQFGKWSGTKFQYKKEQGRDIDFAKVADRQMFIESDWLTEDVQHWLIRNLYESPVVFVEETEGDATILLRRKIMNTSWIDMYHENDTLFKERITIKLSTKTSMIV